MSIVSKLISAYNRGAVVVDEHISSIEMVEGSFSVAQVREALLAQGSRSPLESLDESIKKACEESFQYDGSAIQIISTNCAALDATNVRIARLGLADRQRICARYFDRASKTWKWEFLK